MAAKLKIKLGKKQESGFPILARRGGAAWKRVGWLEAETMEVERSCTGSSRCVVDEYHATLFDIEEEYRVSVKRNASNSWRYVIVEEIMTCAQGKALVKAWALKVLS